MTDPTIDAGEGNREGPLSPNPETMGRRRLLIPEASGLQGDLAAMPPAQRAEILSHHYKQQQLEELVTAESQAFRGCAWTGGIFSVGFSMTAVGGLLSDYLLHGHLFPSGIPSWLEAIGRLMASVGGLLVMFSGLPGIVRLSRWIGAMRARRRLGRVMVMPAATFQRDKAAEDEAQGFEIGNDRR